MFSTSHEKLDEPQRSALCLALGELGTAFDSLGFLREAAHPILCTSARFVGVPRLFLARNHAFAARAVSLLVPLQVRL